MAYLLIYGRLPTRSELDAYIARLANYRYLTPELRHALELIPASAHPMVHEIDACLPMCPFL